jgi:hypothetical protein
MNNTTAQNAVLKSYLTKNRKGITTFDAFEKFGITRLSARIYDLKQMGCKIHAIREQNESTHWNRYFLLKEKTK